MTARPMKLPGLDHPIAIETAPQRVTVTVAGHTLADTRDALVLHEANYPPIMYVPRADADMSSLVRSEHSSYCPYKGDCRYYSIPRGGEKSKNAVWTYEEPYPAVAQIKGYLAFYPDRVDSLSVRER